MPTGRPGSCAACDHPERDALDLALMSGAPYRDLKSRFGVSLRALSQHKSARHHINPRGSDISTPDISTPDVNGPWMHTDALDAFATAVIHALPEHARLSVIDAMAELPATEYFCDHLEASLDPDTAETRRRRSRGEVDVMARTGPNRKWQLTWFANVTEMQRHIERTRERTATG